MTIDRKELYEEKSREAVIKLADFMIAYAVNGIITMKAAEIRRSLKLSIYLFNDASGSLKVLGFHGGVKKFTKSELEERKDNTNYYYKINPECHPSKLSKEVIENLLNERQKVLRRKSKRQLVDIAFSLAFSPSKKLDSNS